MNTSPLILRNESILKNYKSNHKLLEVLKVFTSKESTQENYDLAFVKLRQDFPEVLTEILHQYHIKDSKDPNGVIYVIANELGLLS
ncbi:MAG: hypothetical protein KBD12_00065 [Candidatus Pacebacteria bacterium]|nr:hypothetical protein [Candidatus Paceibacterota bacterium]